MRNAVGLIEILDVQRIPAGDAAELQRGGTGLRADGAPDRFAAGGIFGRPHVADGVAI